MDDLREPAGIVEDGRAGDEERAPEGLDLYLARLHALRVAHRFHRAALGSAFCAVEDLMARRSHEIALGATAGSDGRAIRGHDPVLGVEDDRRVPDLLEERLPALCAGSELAFRLVQRDKPSEHAVEAPVARTGVGVLPGRRGERVA